MGVGWGAAAFAPSIWVAVPFIMLGSAGNGAAIICNQLLVQRGAPDRYRGRALATMMSSNYAVFGLAMAGAGVLTDAFGARWVWIAAGAVYMVAAVAAYTLLHWLPVTVEDEEVTLEAAAQAAAQALTVVDGDGTVPDPAVSERKHDLIPVTEPTVDGADEAHTSGLERIASLLERIERRREVEARRSRR
jgi:MFS family permease